MPIYFAKNIWVNFKTWSLIMFLSILDNNEKEKFLNLVLNVGEVDGDFSDKEKSQILAYTLEMGISLKEKKEYNKSSKELIEFFSKSSKEVKKAILIEVIALMLVDGMKTEEEALLNDMIQVFDIDKQFKIDAIEWYKQMLPLYKKGFELVGIGGL